MSDMTWGTLAMLGGELLLLISILLGIAFFRARAQRKRDRKAMVALIARIKKGKADREQVVEQFLGTSMGLAGDELATTKVAILRSEFSLLQRFIAVYRDRDAAAATRFDEELFGALDPYHALGASQSQAATDTPPEIGDGDDELDFLRKENKRLSDELTITMETMSRMLNDYSTLFVSGGTDAEPIDAQESVLDAGDDGGAPTADMPAGDDAVAEVESLVDEMADAVEEDDAVELQPPAAAEEVVANGDDEVAAILAEAQQQEQSARTDGDESGDAEIVTEEGQQGEQGEADLADIDVAADVIDDLDDLFDAAGNQDEQSPTLVSQGGS